MKQWLVGLTALLLAGGCAGGPQAPEAAPIVPPPFQDPILVISPKSSTLMVGDTLRLSLTVAHVDTTKGFIWVTLDSTIATVSTAGTLKALRAGQTTVLVRPRSDQYMVKDGSVTVQ